MDLSAAIKPQEWIGAINDQLPEGLHVNELSQSQAKKIPARVETCYTMYLTQPVANQRIAAFMEADSFPVVVTRKKKERSIDGRLQVTDLHLIDKETVELRMISEVSKAGLKPLEIVRAVLDLSEQELTQIRVVKEWFKAAP